MTPTPPPRTPPHEAPSGAELAREKAYVRNIERRFLVLRESGLILSSRDFEILHDWFERGVPAELVIQVLEEVFAKTADRPEGRRIHSIAYSRKAVERAWEERRAALLGSASTAAPHAETAFTEPQISAHLGRCSDQTRAAAAALRPPEGGETEAIEKAQGALGAIAARLTELAVAPAPGQRRALPAIESELVALEERAVSVGRETLTPSESEAIGAKAAEVLSAAGSRMSAKAREATLRRAIDAAIRRRLDLPRYSLFTMQG